jgi:hypothetical protein
MEDDAIYPPRSEKLTHIPETKILFRKIRLEQMLINEKRHPQVSPSPYPTNIANNGEHKPTMSTRQKWYELKESFIEWSLLTKFDCYSKIFEYKRLGSRLFWCVLFVACICVTAWLVTKNIVDYMKYEIITRTEIITERPMLFPAITVCDNNPFTTKYAETHIKNVTLEVYGHDLESMTFNEVSKKLIFYL